MSSQPNCVEEIAFDTSSNPLSPFGSEMLYYPLSQDTQVSNDQIEDLRSIFGFVFPDWEGE